MQDFLTHNSGIDIDVNGTQLKGLIVARFDDISRIFGKPMESACDKADAEWHIEFSDGKVATIYNYKDGKSFSPRGKHPENIKTWHLGAKEKEAAKRIICMLGLDENDAWMGE